MSKTANVWDEQALDIFVRAHAISDDNQRKEFIASHCDSEQMTELVESLLADHEKSDGFLETPAINLLSPPVHEEPGTQVGDFRLLEVIGEGGFATVFMAEQESPIRRRVALKVIKPGMASPHFIARFEAERQALALMSHPNIAQFIEAGTTESGRPYFAMELVNGVSITQFCDENSSTIQQRLELFMDLCMAVQHAHQKGIIHRDLKPSNVMVTLHKGGPCVKVIDFGIAKPLVQPLTDKICFTHFGQFIGTPRYMSPEQASMGSDDIDTRTDIFSLGVILFELLTDSTPTCPQRLSESHYDEMRRLIVDEVYPRPSDFFRLESSDANQTATRRSSDVHSLRSTLLGDLDLIVMQSIDKDRDRRYPTAERFANDIGRFLNDETIEARPPSTIYELQKFVRRNRAKVTAICCLAIALLISMAVITWALFRVKSEATIAKNALSQVELANSTLETTKKHLCERFLHDALASAMSPNRELVESQLEAAKEAGATQSQCDMVCGILARTEGNAKLALSLLERSVKLDPDNHAAKCELFCISFDQGAFKEYNRLKMEIIPSQPKTAEDFVFKGRVYRIMGWLEKSLASIEAGQRIHPNPIFEVFRAEVICEIGFRDRDLTKLDAARRQLVRAHSFHGSSHDGIRTALLDTIRKTILVARSLGKEDEYKHLVSLGDEYQHSLRESQVARRHFTRVKYLTEISEDVDATRDAWKCVIKHSDGDLFTTFYAAFLLEHDGYEKAAAEFSRLSSRSHASLAWEATLLALDSKKRRERAASIWEQIGNESPNDRHLAIHTACLLDDQEAFKRIAREWTYPEWMPFQIGYLTGERTESELIKVGPTSGSYLAALRALNRGERSRAIELLQSIDELGLSPDANQLWARGILAEMERRPNWPPPF